MRHTKVEQHLRCLAVGSGLSDSQCLFEVQLEGVEVWQFGFAQSVNHTVRFGRTHTIDEERHGHILHQPANRVLREVGIRHDEIGHVDFSASFGEPVGGNRTDSLCVRDGGNHLSAVVVDAYIDTRPHRGIPFGQMDVDSLVLAVVIEQTAEEVSAENRKELCSRAEQGQVMRYVTRDTTVTDVYMPGIRVRSNERVREGCRQVHIRTANNRNKRFHDRFVQLSVQRYEKKMEYANFWAKKFLCNVWRKSK